MKQIDKYNELIQKIVYWFAKRYYKELYNEKVEMDDYRLMQYEWIFSWPVEISDNYFQIDDILIAELHQIPCKIIQEHYDKEYEAMQNDTRLWINLINYWRKETNPKQYEKDEKESLRVSEENVKLAKKRLEDLLK